MLQGQKLNVIRYQEDDASKILRLIAGDVEDPASDEVKQLATDMLYTMYVSGGIGLSAPQVGVSKRLFVMDVAGTELNKCAFANPTIVKATGLVTSEEGCLSFPGLYVNKTRHKIIKVKAFDVLAGKYITYKAHGKEAICIQHEMAHLNGALLIDGSDGTL